MKSEPKETQAQDSTENLLKQRKGKSVNSQTQDSSSQEQQEQQQEQQEQQPQPPLPPPLDHNDVSTIPSSIYKKNQYYF